VQIYPLGQCHPPPSSPVTQLSLTRKLHNWFTEEISAAQYTEYSKQHWALCLLTNVCILVFVWENILFMHLHYFTNTRKHVEFWAFHAQKTYDCRRTLRERTEKWIRPLTHQPFQTTVTLAGSPGFLGTRQWNQLWCPWWDTLDLVPLTGSMYK